MVDEIPPRPKKNHPQFSEYQNIPEKIDPIKILLQNSILNFLTVLECQMTI